MCRATSHPLPLWALDGSPLRAPLSLFEPSRLFPLLGSHTLGHVYFHWPRPSIPRGVNTANTCRLCFLSTHPHTAAAREREKIEEGERKELAAGELELAGPTSSPCLAWDFS